MSELTEKKLAEIETAAEAMKRRGNIGPNPEPLFRCIAQPNLILQLCDEVRRLREKNKEIQSSLDLRESLEDAAYENLELRQRLDTAIPVEELARAKYKTVRLSTENEDLKTRLEATEALIRELKSKLGLEKSRHKGTMYRALESESKIEEIEVICVGHQCSGETISDAVRHMVTRLRDSEAEMERLRDVLRWIETNEQFGEAAQHGDEYGCGYCDAMDEIEDRLAVALAATEEAPDD